MATGTILLPLLGASKWGSNAAPALAFTNGRPYFAFDSAAQESVVFSFRLPSNYSSGPSLLVQWGGSASTTTTDTVRWGCDVGKITPETGGAADSVSYGTANLVDDDILGTTAKRLQLATLTLTNFSSAAAGDYLALKVYRDAAHVNDDLPEDAWLWSLSLEYTTT